MSSRALTGNDIIQIGIRPNLIDLADGDVGVLDFSDNLAEGKVGKNGNGMVSSNSTGSSATLTLRLISGSSDDKYINGEMNKYLLDPAGYILLNGQITQFVGDGNSTVNSIVFSLSGGFVQKQPGFSSNSEGDTNTSVTEWTLFFLKVDRSVQ